MGNNYKKDWEKLYREAKTKQRKYAQRQRWTQDNLDAMNCIYDEKKQKKEIPAAKEENKSQYRETAQVEFPDSIMKNLGYKKNAIGRWYKE